VKDVVMHSPRVRSPAQARSRHLGDSIGTDCQQPSLPQSL
jgi:hypothetical protein